MTLNQVQTQAQPARPKALGLLPVPALALGAVAAPPAGAAPAGSGAGSIGGEWGR